MAQQTSGSGFARDRFFSTDPAEIGQFVSSRICDVRELRSSDTTAVEFGYETLATCAFTLGHLWTTVATTWDVGQMQEDVVAVQLIRHGTITHAGPAYGETRAGVGDAVVIPPVGEFQDTAEAFEVDLVGFDMAQLARFAEHAYGVSEADLRITGLSPLTRARQRRWNATVTRVRDEVLGNPVLADNAIALDRAFRGLASSFLSTFPTTAFSAAADRGARRRVTESTLRDVRGFLRAHAGEPVGPAEVARVGGAPAVDIASAMSRRFELHPARVLWDARLLGTHRDLCEADPTTTDVASTAARWGFTRPNGFRTAYVREFGELPEETLHR